MTASRKWAAPRHKGQECYDKNAVSPHMTCLLQAKGQVEPVDIKDEGLQIAISVAMSKHRRPNANGAQWLWGVVPTGPETRCRCSCQCPWPKHCITTSCKVRQPEPSEHAGMANHCSKDMEA